MVTSALSKTGERFVTVFGLGHVRPASGTWGSLPPIVVAIALVSAGLTPADGFGTLGWWVYTLAMLAIALVGTLACAVWGDHAEARWENDPPEVVADEAAGMAVALALLPGVAFALPGLTAVTLLYAFLAFRLLDVFKPWPIAGLQRVAGGWGIVLDDLFAGLIAGLLVHVVVVLMAQGM